MLGRFHHNRDSDGVLTASTLQWGLDLKADFKFRPGGQIPIHTRVASGDVTDGLYNDTGLGAGSLARSNLYVKRLYFQARTIRGFEFQIGSLPFFRGEATSVTHYDEAAFIVGERIVLRRPDQLYFDEITYTVGYLGATFTPNVLLRMSTMAKSITTSILWKRNSTSASPPPWNIRTNISNRYFERQPKCEFRRRKCWIPCASNSIKERASCQATALT